MSPPPLKEGNGFGKGEASQSIMLAQCPPQASKVPRWVKPPVTYHSTSPCFFITLVPLSSESTAVFCYILSRFSSTTPCLTGPWIRWRLCIYSRGRRTTLSCSPRPRERTRNANAISGEPSLTNEGLLSFLSPRPLTCRTSPQPVCLSLVTLTRVSTK